MDQDIIVISASKSRAVRLLLVSIAAVAIGVSMIRAGEHVVVGWVSAVFFGLGIPASLYLLTSRNAGEMRIDRHGIEVKSLFKPTKLGWNDVNGFNVGYIRTAHSNTKMIQIDYAPSYRKLRAGRQLASALTGMEGALPNHFSRPAEEVCVILNRAKQKWGTNGGGVLR